MFTKLSVPTPFQIGPVNAFLAGTTLVDPGPDSDEAWSVLVEGLADAGLQPADVEQVLVTHPHPDHFGLAHRLRSEGAAVVASEPAAGIMADFPGSLAYEQEFFTPFLETCGVSDETAQTVTELPESFLRYAPSVETDTVVDPGDTIEVAGTDLTVDDVVGHAKGELIFAYETDGERRAIVGDNVLPEITPNPLLQPPDEPGGERPATLPAFNRSLDRLAEAEYDRFLPGHRGIIEDPTGRIREIRAAHEERTENVAAIVDGPTTPVEVMNELFADLPVTETFSGMSEAVGHLDVLEERGRVTRTERGGVFVYEPTE